MSAPVLIPEGALGIALLADLAIALLDILALGVVLGMLWVYKQTLGAVFKFLIDHTTIHVGPWKVPLLFPLEAADNYVQNAMSVAALGLEIAGGRFFHSLGIIVGWMVNLALFGASTTEHAIAWLKHVHIPDAAKWAARAAFPAAYLTKLIADQVRKLIAHPIRAVKADAHAVVTTVYVPVKAFGRRLSKAEKRIAALAAAVAATGGLVIHPGHTLTLPKTWRGLTKRISRLEKRMHRAEGWLAAGALAAVMAQVLGVTAKCLRSGNVGRTARAICGLDSNLLTSLLGDLVAILGVVSVVEFAEDLRTVEDEAIQIMGALVKEWPS